MNDKPSEIAEYLKSVVLTSGLFEDVYYGDQTVIMKTPICCVSSGPVNSDGQTNRLDHVGSIFFIVYHGKIQDTQENQLECDRLAEALRDLLHKDPQAGDHVIHGWVSSMEPGYAVRSDSLQRVSRITWSYKTRTYNPFGE